MGAAMFVGPGMAAADDAGSSGATSAGPARNSSNPTNSRGRATAPKAADAVRGGTGRPAGSAAAVGTAADGAVVTAGTAAVGAAAPTAPGTVASRPVRVSKRASAPGGRTVADSAQPAASDAGTPQPVASSPQATPSTAAPVAAAVTAADPGPIQSAILAAQAYIYGYPLMEYQRVRQTVETVNTLYSLTSFADPDVDPIWLAIGGGKRPNVDTFYSLAELDLSNGPVVLSIPDMGDRYFSFQLTDPYTNVSGYIGSRTTGSGPGDYAITWTGGPQVDIPGAQTIMVPYASMLALGRTLAGDEADQQAAIALIKQYALDPTGGAVSPVIPIPEPGIGYLDAISAAMALNPPPAIDAPTLEALAQIGVGPGMTVADANLSLLSTITADLAVRVTAALLPVLTTINQYVSAFQGGGWATPPSNIGDYGTDYLLRAGVAEVGLVANTPEEAVYSAGLLGANRFPLSGFGTGSYVLHFAPGEEPPVGAFWSVTVYNSQGRLVPNSQNQYAVSSSRPDELIRRPDGSIDIVFAPRDPGDPGANWLKVPAGAGFSAYLRMYVPDQSVLDGTWVAPPIERRWSIF